MGETIGYGIALTGVKTRDGFCFGHDMRCRGSTGSETVFPQKKPTTTAMKVPAR